MLWPSTRATWNPNVTMRTAYTADDASVFTHATISSLICASAMPSVLATGSAGAATIPSAATGAIAPSAGDGAGGNHDEGRSIVVDAGPSANCSGGGGRRNCCTGSDST